MHPNTALFLGSRFHDTFIVHLISLTRNLQTLKLDPHAYYSIYMLEVFYDLIEQHKHSVTFE